MKTTIVIVIGSFISMLIIAGTFFVLYSANPAAFGGAAAADSSAVPMSDSLFTAIQGKDSSSAVTSAMNASRGDSAKHGATAVPSPSAALSKNTPPVTPAAQKDTTDWKSKAKLLEAMSVESASSILQVMNDKDVKQIIPYIKKRNAAKILASFDPDRAARIIR